MSLPPPFPFPPDWSRPIRERTEYQTSILTARNGMEQRARLRTIPRRGLEFEISLRNGRSLDALLWARQGQVFGVPWWPDQVRYSGTLAVGATSISGDFTHRLFPLSTMVMVWESSDRCEIQTVESASDSAITMSALSATYTDPLILPVFVGRLEARQNLSRVTSRFTQGRVRFACEVQIGDPIPSAPAFTPTYSNLLLTTRPDWQGVEQTAGRMLSRFDPGMGVVDVADRGGVSFQGQDFRWFLKGRAAVQSFRDFLNTVQGARVPFWVPTWREDMVLSQQAASGSNAIVIQAIGYTARMFPDVARRYLAIRNPNGGWLYRKVTSSGVSGNEETIGLDAQHGVVLPAGTTASFLTLCRMAEDNAEIEWSTTEFGHASTRFVEIPKEVPA